MPTRSSKRIRNDDNKPKENELEEELVVVVKIKTSHPPVSTAPLSALAARRAAINAGLYKEPEVEITKDDTEEEEEEDCEGMDVLSATDEEDVELREAMEHDDIVIPISGTATPNGGSTPARPSTPMQQSKKFKVKM